MKTRVAAFCAVLLLAAAAARAQDRGTALGGIEFGSHPKEVAATLTDLGLKVTPRSQDKRFPFDQTFEGPLNGRTVRVTAWFDPQASLESLTRALTLAIQVENEEAKANLLNAIGVAYKRLNKPDEALQYYRQSLEIKRGRDDKRGIALTLGELASVHDSLGKTTEALANYTEALRLYREIGNKKGIGTTLINFGGFHG